jgi:hypothetical protein
MDVPLYAIALSVFALLYLAIGVFLGITLIVTLLVMLAYLSVRHGKLPENYPHGLSDSMITITFIGVTWGIFTWLGPKNPIPFAGTGLVYTQGPIPLSQIIIISFVLAVIFLTVFGFLGRDLQGAGTGSGGGGGADSGRDGSKPKQGVGA